MTDTYSGSMQTRGGLQTPSRRDKVSRYLRKKENEFMEQYIKQGKKGVKKAAMAVRPELKEKSAEVWGFKVIKDPSVRERMHVIEQGGIVRLHELLNSALDAICDFLTDPDTPAKVRFDAAKLVLQRIYGAVPDTVNLVKFSIFDGEGKKDELKRRIQIQIEGKNNGIAGPEDVFLQTGEREAS